MQKFIEELDSGDRRVANNWTIVAFGLYGSILAGLAIYTAVEHSRDASLAAADVSTLAQPQR